jgi:putative oxidoreductase
MLVSALTDYADWGLLALRVAVGIIFIVHGVPKLRQARMMGAGIAQSVRLSPSVGYVWMLAQGAVEVVGGVLLICGILTQLVALAFVVIMIGAIGFKVAIWKTGFMSQQTTGWEFDFVLLFANLLLLLAGPGSLALMPGGLAS